jgi:hypothetical protein
MGFTAKRIPLETPDVGRKTAYKVIVVGQANGCELSGRGSVLHKAVRQI